MSKAEVLLNVSNLAVFYGDIQALWDVSFEVRKGQIVTLVGANGAGKTTTLNTIAGLMRLRSGSITFAGQLIHKANAHTIVERGLALVSEERNLFPHMSVSDNLQLGAYARRSRHHMNETLEEVLDIFPILGDRLKQAAGTMSGGEQQMLAIARGLMSRPEMIIFDEPSLGLAPMLVEKLFRVIADINQRGITVLLVEQNVHRAVEIADMSYLLETGRIVLRGPGDEMLRNEHVRSAYMGL